MKPLTLTKGERNAFEWVAGRYATGHEVVDVLLTCLDPDQSWYDDGALTIQVTDAAIDLIRELSAEEYHLWPCFAPELKCKMLDLIGGLTLQAWLERGRVVGRKFADCVVCVPDDSPHRSDLWELSDYYVSSVSAGTIYLVKKVTEQ